MIFKLWTFVSCHRAVTIFLLLNDTNLTSHKKDTNYSQVGLSDKSTIEHIISTVEFTDHPEGDVCEQQQSITLACRNTLVVIFNFHLPQGLLFLWNNYLTVFEADLPLLSCWIIKLRAQKTGHAKVSANCTAEFKTTESPPEWGERGAWVTQPLTLWSRNKTVSLAIQLLLYSGVTNISSSETKRIQSAIFLLLHHVATRNWLSKDGMVLFPENPSNSQHVALPTGGYGWICGANHNNPTVWAHETHF